MEAVARDAPRGAFATSPGEVPVDCRAPNHDVPGAASVPGQESPESSYYALACDQSLLSGDVDRWMGASVTTGVQGSRPAVMQRSTLATDFGNSLPGMWYMLAMSVMPIINMANMDRWRCSQGALLNVVELGLSHLNTACARLRCHIRSLAQNRLAREIFASAMDVILVFYAVGFLFLSVYQAVIFA